MGYVARIVAHDNTAVSGPYIIQAVFLLLAPILFAASLYMVFGRVVKAVHGESCSPISPRWTTRLFVFGDISSFIVQCIGAAVLTSAKTLGERHTGQNIIVGGLVLQILMFGVFVLCAVVFNTRFSKVTGADMASGEVPWQVCLIMLYMTSIAIMIRNIFRVIEFAMGQTGYLLQNEWPAYVFDGMLMVLTMAVFFVWYPSQLQPQSPAQIMEMGKRTRRFRG
jgi:hypothetical protein